MATTTPSIQSDLTDAPTSDLSAFVFAQVDLHKRLDEYTKISTSDDTECFLKTVFKYLPPGGQQNLAEDVLGCNSDERIRQLVKSIETGLLLPVKALGGKPQEVMPNPRLGAADSVENLASRDIQSISRNDQERLRSECMRRDGNRCVITGVYDTNMKDRPRGATIGFLEAAHILPFALGTYRNEAERHRICLIWTNIYRYFPEVRARLNFLSTDINSEKNVMMLLKPLHQEFGNFSLSFMATDIPDTYRLKTFDGFSNVYNWLLPANRLVAFTSSDQRYSLPHPVLLGIHDAIAHILHLTGRGEKADKLQQDYNELGCLAPGGTTDIESLLALSTLGPLELYTNRQRSAPAGEQKSRSQSAHTRARVPSNENQRPA
ncbi:hypothetical protein BO78DRAFT_377758 [Aspergillus sclerotiicarbonarius CBS 121057]|uniref:HNH nuclease domain-containing protein n=1 Tax=Aspergillus sclerotiicarbonarius (strain CBS 121057 / IBT 28362) TaxID=1448318 RepID=A0A319F8Q3_ASPSB|nr:hypothetical protein BO78DRAFT_377758 [Aspergillus sclerotiicarbonarius CBS 121057]